MSFVARSSVPKAERLRSQIEGDFPPVLLGWGVLNRPPNRVPWGHLVKVLDNL